MEQAGVSLIAQGANAFDVDMKSATNATNAFVDATDKGAGKVSAASQIMIGGLRHMGTIAVDVMAQALKATAGFVGDSVNLAGDFEQGMNEFRVAAGKDIDTAGLEQFHDLFLDLGKQLPVSTTEVQQAAIELVKGGIDPATVAAGGLEQSIKFAAAAMKGDLAGAAEISSKIVAGWANVGATAADKANLLTHATDLLTKAANASSTDVQQLSQGIFNAQGIAKTAGVSLDDLTTTIAALAGNFSSSSEAGNSLKNMIARLQPTTDPATEAMAGLGLYTDEAGSAFYDAAGNFVGFETAAQLLQDSLKGLTKEQQASTLQQIFGNDAMSSAAALAAMGGAGYQEMADKLTNAMGVQEAGTAIQSGYNTAMENAKGSVEALQIQLGEHLTPIMTTLLDDVITPGINVLSDLSSAVLGDEEAFNKLSPTMQGVATGIQDLADGFAQGMQLAQDIGAEIQTLIGTFDKSGVSTASLGSAVDDLSGIWTKAQGVVADVMAGYQSIAMAVLPQITQFVDDHGAEISAFFKTTYDTIISIVNLALDLYDAIVPRVLGSVAQFIDDHGTAIQSILKGAWDVISGTITGALALIEGAIKISLAAINGDWDGAWTAIQAMSVTFVESIGKVITGFLEIIAGAFDTSLSEILQVWENNWAMLVDIATETDWAQVGSSIVQGIQKGLADAWDGLVDWFTDKLSGLFDAGMERIKGGSPALEFAPMGQSMVQGIALGLTNTWPTLTDLVGSLSGDLIDDMRSIGEDIQNAIADGFGATASIDRQIAKNMDAVSKIDDDFYRNATENALRAAQVQAEAYADPETGAKFFKMKSAQILEFQKLQQEINEEENAATKRRLQDQQILILKAQEAEMSAFETTNSRTDSPLRDMADQVNAVMKALADIKLTDDQLKIVDLLAGVWSGLQVPIVNTSAYANPPASPAQQSMWRASGPQTVDNSRHVPMTVYTNQSPAAMQQSLAIAAAMMP